MYAVRLPRSFRGRLTLRWTAVFGVVLVATLGAVYFGVRHSLYNGLEADLRTLAATEVASGIDEYQGVHMHRFDNPAIVNEAHVQKFVQILTPRYSILDQSEYLDTTEPLISERQFHEAQTGRAVLSDVSLDGRKGRAISLPAHKNGETFVFVVAVPLSAVETALESLLQSLLAVGIVALLATACAGYRLATSALRPVDAIIRRTRVIGEGSLGMRLDDPGTRDELGRLTDVLNDMLDRLYGLIRSHQRFTADASHELRSPLTALRGRIEISLRRARTADEYRRVLEECLEEVKRLSQLAENLLELVRADARRLDLDLSEVDLAPLVDRVCAERQLEASERGVSVSASVPESLTVIADEHRLERVLSNLLGNAIQYSKPAGGTVTITAGNGGNECRIEVRDTGIGLDSDQKQHIFDRFWRADKARGVRNNGLGLGLAICNEIVHAHGGSIEVESAPDQGSAFRVLLPMRLE